MKRLCNEFNLSDDEILKPDMIFIRFAYLFTKTEATKLIDEARKTALKKTLFRRRKPFKRERIKLFFEYMQKVIEATQLKRLEWDRPFFKKMMKKPDSNI